MRAAAKVSLLVFFPLLALTSSSALLRLFFWPVISLSGLPIAWYVLFTLPEERANEYDVIRRVALGQEVPIGRR